MHICACLKFTNQQHIQWFEREVQGWCQSLPGESGWQSGCEFMALVAELEWNVARGASKSSDVSINDYAQTKLGELVGWVS